MEKNLTDEALLKDTNLEQEDLEDTFNIDSEEELSDLEIDKEFQKEQEEELEALIDSRIKEILKKDENFLENKDSSLDYEEDVELKQNVNIKLINPQTILRIIKRRLLNEVYNPISKKYIRKDKKRPLFSKSFVNEFEVRVLKFYNINFFTQDLDGDIKKFINYGKRDLLTLIDKVLYDPECNEPSKSELVYGLYKFLLLNSLNNISNGNYNRLLRKREEVSENIGEKEENISTMEAVTNKK